MLGIVPFISGKKRRDEAVKLTFNTKQNNTGIISIHRINKKNIGDFYCGPHLYFKELEGTGLDISDARTFRKSVRDRWINSISENKIIVGGGGLLNNDKFKSQMNMFENLASKDKKIVLWGVGHNEGDLTKYNENYSYWNNISNFGLVGTRDYSLSKNNWLPCVSCLNPIFDKKFDIKQQVGIIFNRDSNKSRELKKELSQFEFSSNTTSLDEMIEFIGQSEIIVTNSYHAMYWAILLNKKVLSIPSSTKFFDFKYKTPMVSFDNFKDHLKIAPSYSGVLQECREINLKFAEKAFNYLNI